MQSAILIRNAAYNRENIPLLVLTELGPAHKQSPGQFIINFLKSSQLANISLAKFA